MINLRNFAIIFLVLILGFVLGYSELGASEQENSNDVASKSADTSDTSAIDEPKHAEEKGNHSEHPEILEVEPWMLAPFVLLLLSIAVIPLIAHEWWELNRHKALIALPLGAMSLIIIFFLVDGTNSVKSFHIAETMLDYAAFIALLASLFIISGGIHISGDFRGKPMTNLKILAIGGLLASLIGTTGAAMLLIRPLLKANKYRKNKVHSVIFFIFVVANCGGLLTPLGDPPLFLGFLKGVPFEWTLINLWSHWIFVNGILLFVFFAIDSFIWRREGGMPALVDSAKLQDIDLDEHKEKMRISGKFNFFLLAGVVAVVFSSGVFSVAIHQPSEGTVGFIDSLREGTILEKMAAVKLGQAFLMMLIAAISLKYTPLKGIIRKKNEFTFHAIIEVAVLFFGIFLAMIPALQYLNAHGGALVSGIQGALNIPGNVAAPSIPFWLTGSLSSFLDNAPTYLTFLETFKGALGVSTVPEIASGSVNPISPLILAAISTGAVFMGAMTYIGNGPNFMVKSIAEESGVKMPSFFGYMIWSVLILIPIFILVNLIWFASFPI